MLAEAGVVEQKLKQREDRQQIEKRPGNAKESVIAKGHHQRVAYRDASLAGQQVGQAGEGYRGRQGRQQRRQAGRQPSTALTAPQARLTATSSRISAR